MGGRFLITAIFPLLLVYPGEAAAIAFSDLKLAYEANFDDGTLNPSVDALGIGAMQIGDTLISGTNPSAVLENGGVTLSITRPSGAPMGPVAVGAVATPVSFGQGSIFGLRAVFAQPTGAHDPADTWAVGLTARTGAVSDLPAALRAAATFQVMGSTARLNTPFATTPGPVPISQSEYDAIFAPPDPDPTTFTLELLIDRTTGLAYASLTSGAITLSRSNFMYSAFGSNFGPDITAFEPGIAVASGPDTTASVRLLDFQVFTAPEAPTWAVLGCGIVMLGAGRRAYARKAKA